MVQCPQCGSKITVHQKLLCSYWTPIVCSGCHTRLIYGKKELEKLLVPVFLILLINSSVLAIVTFPQFQEIRLVGSTVLLYILLAVGLLFFLKVFCFLKDPRLEVKV